MNKQTNKQTNSSNNDNWSNACSSSPSSVMIHHPPTSFCMHSNSSLLTSSLVMLPACAFSHFHDNALVMIECVVLVLAMMIIAVITWSTSLVLMIGWCKILTPRIRDSCSCCPKDEVKRPEGLPARTRLLVGNNFSGNIGHHLSFSLRKQLKTFLRLCVPTRPVNLWDVKVVEKFNGKQIWFFYLATLFTLPACSLNQNYLKTAFQKNLVLKL